MAMFIGRVGDQALFTDGDRGVIVDTMLSLVSAVGDTDSLTALHDWADGEFTETDESAALAAFESLNAAATPEPTGRLYTVPRGVQNTAKRATEQYLQHGRGGSPAAVAVAQTLSSGGQIPFESLSMVTSFFERHEADRFSEQWNPDADGTPSAASISWGMWGGDAAKRWASTIVERERESISASAPAIQTIEAFDSDDIDAAPEFLARVRMDGSGIDRLYRIDTSGSTFVWDDGHWEDLADAKGTVWSYDESLDDPYDTVEKTHITIDPDSAVIIAGLFHRDPFSFVSIEQIDADESWLAVDAIEGEDWDLVDFAITAAGTGNDGDGIDTPEERAVRATQQVRDGSGKFAKVGTRVMIDGNPSATGNITRVNPADGTVSVILPNGNSVTIPGKSVEGVGKFTTTIPGQPVEVPRVDTSGILGEPRTPSNRVGAQIPGTLPAMTRDDLHNMLHNFPAYVKAQRDAFSPAESAKGVRVQGKNSLNKGKTGRALEEAAGQKLTVDAYKHPLISEWLKKKNRHGTPNVIHYQPITASAEAVAGEQSPETTDVQALYLAIVAPDDPRAVLQLVSLIPSSDTSNTPMTYVREEGEWVRDPQVLNDLNSATPPPVIPLDTETLDDVLRQVDGVTEQAADEDTGTTDAAPAPADPAAAPAAPADPAAPAPVAASLAPLDLDLMVLFGTRKDLMRAITAAGGLDRNRGGADKLRRYWTVGKGGAKIRWGTGGDWTRCVRYLGKYMGERAKGYCALRHKEMTGMWAGDKDNRRPFSRNKALSSIDVLVSQDQYIARAFLNAEAHEARLRVRGLTASATTAGEVQVGARFMIPLVIPEQTETGDNRWFEDASILLRELPLPLMWQEKTASGHDGSYVVGRIDSMERIAGGIGNAYGVFDTGVWGREAERLVRAGMLRGVSADMDKFKASAVELASEKDDEDVEERLVVTKARIMGVTIVAKPAFQECKIILLDEETPQEDEDMIPDGIYVDDVDPLEAEALVAAGYTASVIPLAPPTDWFNNPELSGPTPMSIDDSGRVFGHIATWDTLHVGMSNVRPPRSKSNYGYFHSGVIRTDEGKDVPVGQLTLAGGHAGLEASAREAVKHYDDTMSAIADVHAGEDQFGIWVAGSLRPEATPEQIRALRASAPSGDWRSVRGSLELVAICQVNVPGFPIARARVASGQPMALVAAGAMALAKMKSNPIEDMAFRLDALEQFRAQELQVQVAPVRAKFQTAKEEHKAQLAAKAAALSARVSASTDREFIPSSERKALTADAQALSMGVFSITNTNDLIHAISAVEFASEPESARKYITSRARALKASALLPEEWPSLRSDTLAARVSDLRARTALAAAATKDEDKENDPKAPNGLIPGESETVNPADYDPKYTPDTQPRDGSGRFRDVLARLRSNLGTSGNQDVLDKIEETENLDNTGDYKAAVESAADLINTIDRIDTKALNPEALKNVRDATGQLGKVIANLPLPFGEEAEKVRFSDLPPALRKLTEDLIKKVEEKIGLEDANVATKDLRSFMSGSDVYNQSEVSAQLNKLLRLLT